MEYCIVNGKNVSVLSEKMVIKEKILIELESCRRLILFTQTVGLGFVILDEKVFSSFS